jgi:hypothetical protein
MPPLGQGASFAGAYNPQAEYGGLPNNAPGTPPAVPGVPAPTIYERMFNAARDGIIEGMKQSSKDGAVVPAQALSKGGFVGRVPASGSTSRDVVPFYAKKGSYVASRGQSKQLVLGTSGETVIPSYAANGSPYTQYTWDGKPVKSARNRAIDLVRQSGGKNGVDMALAYAQKLQRTANEVEQRNKQQKDAQLAKFSAGRDANAQALAKKAESEKQLALQNQLVQSTARAKQYGIGATISKNERKRRAQNAYDAATRREVGEKRWQQILASRMTSSYAADGKFPGAPRGTDTERYMLNNGDVVLNQNASKMFGKAETVTSGGDKVRGNGNLPYYLTPNEKIIPGDQAKQIGYDKLRGLNNFGLMQKGGAAGFPDSPFAGPASNNGNNVSVGGVNVGYNYDPNKSKSENDANLVAATVGMVEKELSQAMKQKHKSRIGA